MEQVEKQVYEIIGKSSKFALCLVLGISRPTLDRRLEKGGWLKSEIEIIKKLSNG